MRTDLTKLTAQQIVEAFNRSGEYTDKFSIQNLKCEHVYFDQSTTSAANDRLTAVYSGDLWDDVNDCTIPMALMYITVNRDGFLGSF